jgi:proteasome lid subunit RPN8/RPN11
MISFIRATIRAFVAPRHIISCRAELWHSCISELARRGNGKRESGAFLLGAELCANGHARREIRHFVCYDDLDPHALDTGIVDFSGEGYTPLWNLCRETNLKVVADVHTHPGKARQSEIDKRNPMIAIAGHVAFIVPNYATFIPAMKDLGIYRYTGAHEWRDLSGVRAPRHFYTGVWA